MASSLRAFLKAARRKAADFRDVPFRWWCEWQAVWRLEHPRRARAHGLPGELILSLTSYPPRFGTLHLTLGYLLDQSLKPDCVILWIAHADVEKLPNEVRKLEARGLEIRACDDLRSFKKLVPALEAFPEAFIATADDDVYYERSWLGELVKGVSSSPGTITCHRAHRIKRSADGKASPYLQWEFDVQDERARRPSRDLLPTGVGGMLYPPESLDMRAVDRELFLRLCPHGDDLWFYWCARMAGTLHKKVGDKMRPVMWPGSQNLSLWASNEAGGNDAIIAALESEFPKP